MYAQTGNFFSAKYIVCCSICAELPTKGGMFSDTPKGSKSCMVNLLSAMMESFSWNGKFNNPLLTTISLSEMLLVYNWLLKVIAPTGEMPINPFRVLCFFCSYLIISHLKTHDRPVCIARVMSSRHLFRESKKVSAVAIGFHRLFMVLCCTVL